MSRSRHWSLCIVVVHFATLQGSGRPMVARPTDRAGPPDTPSVGLHRGRSAFQGQMIQLLENLDVLHLGPWEG